MKATRCEKVFVIGIASQRKLTRERPFVQSELRRHSCPVRKAAQDFPV